MLTRKTSMAHVRLFTLLAFTTLFYGHCVVMAQEPAQVLTNDELRTRLKYLQQELASELDALARTEESQHQELRESKGMLRKLAGRLLNDKIRLERLRKRSEKLAKEAEGVDTRTKSQLDMIKKLTETVRTSAEHLEIYLTEIPADQRYILRIRQVLQNLPQSMDAMEPEIFCSNLRSLLKVQECVHRDAGNLYVRRTKLRTAGGLLEDVKLLAIGNVAFAYETLEHGSIGLALSSPADASGYRWTENLAAPEVRAVKRAIVQVESAASGIAAIPMDVTGRLRIDAQLNTKTLAQRLVEGGPVMLPLAAVAILALFISIERIYRLYLRNTEKPLIIRQVLMVCDAKRYDEAERLLEQSDTVTSRTLAACLRQREHGARAMEDGVHEQLLHELPRLRRFLSGLAILAAVAPLLGLLGTVTGIIQTFSVIRMFGNANPGLMAGGISEALITTATGLVIAIPILLCRGLLRGRMEKIVGDAQRHAATLLNRLSERG